MAPARNELCLCGSGKKYKKCHALKAVEREGTMAQHFGLPSPTRPLTDHEVEMFEAGCEEASRSMFFITPREKQGFFDIFHSKLTNPIAGETLYWARDVELARVRARFVSSFALRCSDEYEACGGLIGTFADADSEYPHVDGDENSRLMDEFRAYLDRAKSKGVLPESWGLHNDDFYAAYAFRWRRYDDGTASDIYEKEILRRIAADVMGDRVEDGEGGTWFSGEFDESESESESENENESENEDVEALRADVEALKMTMTKTKTCATCAADAWTDGGGRRRSCFECKCVLVRYCSKACQKADWANHKAMCREARASGTGREEWSGAQTRTFAALSPRSRERFV